MVREYFAAKIAIFGDSFRMIIHHIVISRAFSPLVGSVKVSFGSVKVAFGSINVRFESVNVRF